MHTRIFLLLTGLLALGGCSSLGEYKERPRVSIAGVQLTEANLFEQRYRLQLRVQNPNPVDLPIRGLDYQVEVNGNTFATGVSDRAVVVPRYGSALLDVDGISTLSSVIRQLKDLDPLKQRQAQYVIRGNVRVTDRDLLLPFEHRGDLPFGLKPSFLSFRSRERAAQISRRLLQ